MNNAYFAGLLKKREREIDDLCQVSVCAWFMEGAQNYYYLHVMQLSSVKKP